MPGENPNENQKKQYFEATIRGPQVALANAETQLRDTNDTKRFAVAATIAQIDNPPPPEKEPDGYD